MSYFHQEIPGEMIQFDLEDELKTPTIQVSHFLFSEDDFFFSTRKPQAAVLEAAEKRGLQSTGSVSW